MELIKGDFVFDVRYGVSGEIVEVGREIKVSFTNRDIGDNGLECYLPGGVLYDGRKVLKYFDDSLNFQTKAEHLKYMSKVKQFLALLKTWE